MTFQEEFREHFQEMFEARAGEILEEGGEGAKTFAEGMLYLSVYCSTIILNPSPSFAQIYNIT